MRCRKCNYFYRPTGTGACPRCGYVPPRRGRRRRRPARTLQQRLDREIAVVAFFVGFLVLPILTMLTGQLLLGGSLILLVLGTYTLLYSWGGNLSNLPHPRQTATIGYVFGVLIVAGGVGCMVWYVRSGPAWPSFAWVRRLLDGGWKPFLYNLVPYGVVAVAGLAAALLDRLWRRQEATQCELDGQAGRVFPIPPNYRTACITALLLISLVDWVMLTAATNAERTHVSVASGVGLFLVLCPVAAFLVWMIARNSGHVVLTGDAVVLVRLWGRREMRYRDVVEVRERSFSLPPNLVLVGKKGRLRIPRTVANLYQLELDIRWRVKHASAPPPAGGGHD